MYSGLASWQGQVSVWDRVEREPTFFWFSLLGCAISQEGQPRDVYFRGCLKNRCAGSLKHQVKFQGALFVSEVLNFSRQRFIHFQNLRADLIELASAF